MVSTFLILDDSYFFKRHLVYMISEARMSKFTALKTQK